MLGGSRPAWANDDASVLVLGRISDNPKQHYEQLKPLLDYVVPRMRDVGITQGRILMAKDVQQMTSYLRRGRVDWVTETAGNGMNLQQRADARPLLLTERGGASTYHSVIFVRKDSGIDNMNALKGRSIAFQGTSSTSAYLVPSMMLLRHGLHPEILLSPMDRAGGESVGYVFAGTELNISAWVHKRLVDAGALSSMDWEDPKQLPPAFKRDMKILARSPDYPRALEIVRSGLDPKVEQRLREVLLQAVDDPEGRAAMQAFFRTGRFMPLDAQSLSALNEMARGAARVRDLIE